MIETTVLVIGGGATGVGVARDLAMRGIDVVLVERDELASGTTSRHTGLVHSGARYVLRDPPAAIECYRENQILRRIASQYVVNDNAFFVLLPEDDPEYVPRWLEGCHTAGIPVEEMPVGEVLRTEPAVNRKILRAFCTPDTTGDPFRLIEANAVSARHYGARILLHHEATSLVEEQGRVVGAWSRNLQTRDKVFIRAAVVVNAAGVWSGRIAATVGLRIPLLPSKGVMVAFNYRALNRPVARCHPPSDADAMMPSHSVLISGSTDGDICDPDDLSINPHHVRIVLQESEKLVPGISAARILRVWAGIRPLYTGQQTFQDTRHVTRSHALLDHEVLDGKPGLVTIVGGKWTTYRLMAQEVSDLVCRKLGVARECRTHLEALPGCEIKRRFWPGTALQRVEQTAAMGDLVCECELVTIADVFDRLEREPDVTLHRLRQLHRLGVGSCQGGVCTYRATGLLHMRRRPSVSETNGQLADFLQERWKGMWPVLWGRQLRQVRFNQVLYVGLLGADRGMNALEPR
ncbi:MAG: anaerobic glycerol-3-phosphate dehydrogenase subunit GlpA [Anaerolineae bacterium]